MKEANPLVSVIIPFFATPIIFMHEAIESVIGQTYSDWELLLVNDGARSECLDLAKEYAKKFPERIQVIQHPEGQNLGISASRQLGVENARGVYVAFLDSDDIWLPDKLSQQVALLEKHPEAGMLYGNTLYWYSWAGETTTAKKDFIPAIGDMLEGVMPPATLLPLFLTGKTVVPCTCSLLIRRSTFELVGGFEKEFTGMYDEQVFYAKVCIDVPVYVSQLCLDWYRQHPLSISTAHTQASKARETRRAYLEWLQKYLISMQNQDRQVWAALRREIWYLHIPGYLANNDQAAALVKRLKKWMLKLVDLVLPDSIRQSMWAPQRTIRTLVKQR